LEAQSLWGIEEDRGFKQNITVARRTGGRATRWFQGDGPTTAAVVVMATASLSYTWKRTGEDTSQDNHTGQLNTTAALI
jgi:hypothetical protein